MSAKVGLAGQDPAVRRKLAATLHTRITGLAAGALCGVTVGGMALTSATAPAMRAISLTMIVLAMARLAMAIAARTLKGRAGDTCRAAYAGGALAYAGVLGLFGACTLLTPNNADLRILAVSYAAVFGAGIAVGNAGRPLVALGQMALSFVPLVIAGLIVGTPELITLSLVLPLLTLGLATVTLNIFSMLSAQVRAARASAEMAAQMREQALTDPITGMANRTGFEEGARRLIAESDGVAPLVLFWLDLHRFKEVNDTLGHQAGDAVLRMAARRIAACAPEGAVMARFGSDEFLLLASLPSREHVDQLAGQLSSDLALPMRIDGHRIESGASIGVKLLDQATPDLDRLMKHTDIALYHAKVSGRNQVAFFHEGMTRELVRRKEIEAELRAAIQKDELSIYFQPIVDLETGHIRAFEALVRWFHPVKGELYPDEFIPVAEDTGLIITLGNWITRTAAAAAAHWPADVMLAVNLSPVQIHAPGAALGILAALRRAGLDPARLELEVTESLFLEDDEATSRFMQQLADEGVRFALDDFGTGYSSLHYINKYPFRTIKVDRSFVSGQNAGIKSDAIIRAVAEMGATLGMEIVAEGLETAGQVANVRRAGCTLGQGYHFSRAVPEHLAQRLLDEDRLPEDGDGKRLAG